MATSMWVRIGAVLILVGLTVVTPAGEAGAASKFEATAGSELARVGVRPDPPILFEQPFDLGGAVAQARLNSLGASTAYASTPFPGDALVQLPGLTAGFTGGQIDLPEYPLYVSSDYPSAPEGSAQAGSVSLEARSRQFESRSRVGDGVNRSEAMVELNPDDDVVAAEATTVIGLVNLGPLLSIDGLRSTAHVSRTPGGDVERSSTLTAGALTILGQQVALPADQLGALDSEPLVNQLAEQGIRLSYVKPVESADGVVSAGLQVAWLTPVPNYGQALVTVQLGRTFAHATNTPLESSELPGLPNEVGEPAPVTQIPSREAEVGDPASEIEPVTVVVGDTLLPAAVVPESYPIVGGSFPIIGGQAEQLASPSPPAVPPPQVTVRQVAVSPVVADRTPVSRLFGLLALVGLLMVGMVATFGRHGVRER